MRIFILHMFNIVKFSEKSVQSQRYVHIKIVCDKKGCHFRMVVAI